MRAVGSLENSRYQKDVPPGVVLGAAPLRSPGLAVPANHVVVRTVAATAGASAGRDAPTIGLLVVDEAYQVTFADVLCASAKAEQILLVGDQGQIGPVTTSIPAMWQGRPDAPTPAGSRGVRPPGQRSPAAPGRQLPARARIGRGDRGPCTTSRSGPPTPPPRWPHTARSNRCRFQQPATRTTPPCSPRSRTGRTPCSAPP